MALIHALMSLRERKEIASFDMESQTRATIHLSNGKSYIVYMPGDYIVGQTVIFEALRGSPKPNYIIYNEWDKVTSAALEEAKRNGIEMVKFGRFRYILDELNG